MSRGPGLTVAPQEAELLGVTWRKAPGCKAFGYQVTDPAKPLLAFHLTGTL